MMCNDDDNIMLSLFRYFVISLFRYSSFLVELFATKSLRLIYLITQERSLPREFLESTVILLTQIGEMAIHSVSSDVTMMFVKCCNMVRNGDRVNSIHPLLRL